MELRQLATFREVARTLSFTRAADALNYAQSSVSAQIQELEEELDTLLFERLGRRIALTDAGARLLQYADKILALADEARVVVANREEPVGALTITAPESLCTYRLPAVLSRFRRQFPRIEMIFRPMGARDDWERQLAEGIADAALVLLEPFQPPSLMLEVLRPEPIFVVTTPDHPLANCDQIKLSDLRAETLLLTEAGCAYRALFERRLQNAGVRPGAVLEFHSVEAIKACTMSGMGIAVLPGVAVHAELAAGRLVVLPCTESTLAMSTCLAWHKDKWLSPALRAFIQLTREVLCEETALPINRDYLKAPALI
ncbi:LysR family transcriptional regulator [soil metagenome]